MQFGIDRQLVVVEDQRGDIGEDDHREDIGRQQPADLVAYEPSRDDHHGQEGSQKRHQSDEHPDAAGRLRTAPEHEVQVGDREQQEGQVAEEEAPFALRGCPAHEKVAEEDQADDELHAEEQGREAEPVAADHLPRHGGEKRQSGERLDRSERPGEPVLRKKGLRHDVSFFAHPVQNQCHAPDRKKSGGVFAFFWVKDFARTKISITFALAFSNGGIAQLVRAHDS